MEQLSHRTALYFPTVVSSLCRLSTTRYVLSHEMLTAKMDCYHASRRNWAHLKTIFAVQLAWLSLLVVILNEVLLEGSVMAHFSLNVQEWEWHLYSIPRLNYRLLLSFYPFAKQGWEWCSTSLVPRPPRPVFVASCKRQKLGAGPGTETT